MNIIPWRNKRKTGDLTALGDLRHEMDRLFDSFMSLGRDSLDMLSGLPGSGQWVPNLDVSETDDEIAVHAEIPGVDPKDLEISVVGNRLTIAGEKRESREETSHGVHVSERRYGSFRRSVELPSAVDPKAVSADCVQGVLSVKLKKVHAAQARRITVNQG